MLGTMPQKKKPTGGAGKYKPHRAYRIPEALAVLVDELVEEEIGTDGTEHVRRAVRQYLVKRGKLKAAPGEE